MKHNLHSMLLQAGLTKTLAATPAAPMPEIKKMNKDGPLTRPLTVEERKKNKTKPIKPATMHVDDFIDNGLRFYGGEQPNEKYARFVLNYFRLPATLHMDFAAFMTDNKLFCTYEGKRYRVTGCSRMGDIWLNSDFKAVHGYEHRVDPMSVTDFSDSPISR